MNKQLLLLAFAITSTTTFTQQYPLSAAEAYRRGIIGGLARTQENQGTRSRAGSTSTRSPKAATLRPRYGIRANEARTNRKVKSTF